MKAVELMRTKFVTLKADDPIEDAFDVMIGKHIHGAPVVDRGGALIGVVSQLDIYFGRMTRDRLESEASGEDSVSPLTVRDVMTSPAVSVTEETDVVDLCRMMFRLRIHRVPVVRETEVRGLVSSLDVCKAVADGRIGPTD